MKSTKRSLFTSALALFLCFSMLLGTTFAWFTDTVTSGNNKIVSGSLKVDLELFDKETGTWESIKNSQKAIFDHKNWEPGYTDVKVLRITNKGSLALKWDATIIPLDELTALADVIDVYVYSGKTAPNARPGRNDLEAEGYHKVGTLREFAEGLDTESASALLAGESDYLGIALKMRESAGNEYKNTSCGEFDIRIVATQYSAESEKDSFDENYDNEAQFPVFKPADVNLSVQTANGFVTADAYKKTGSASMKALAGTKVTDDRLSLNVSKMAASGSNVRLEENEAILPLDVHVDGVAPDNTKPIIITLDEAMTPGLNIGNYKLYHVEDGVANLMTAVSSLDELDAHNEFFYDPATGNVSLAMATFSEVAMVADTENAWEGNFDYSWYNANATDFEIANADQLAAFGAIVGGMNKVTGRNDGVYSYSEEVIQDSFNGKTVKLTSDINLGDKEDENNSNIIFYPIGYWNNEGTYERKPLEERTTAVSSGFYNFCGTFDGNGHTVSNFYQNTWEMKGDHNWYDTIKEQYYRDGMGLFGKVYGGTVKNLTVKNFSSDGEIATTGVIAAYADGATFENIAIFNCNPRVYNIGNGGIVGCVGWYAKEADLKTTFKNITVDNSNKISALWGSYDVACGGIVGQYYPTSGQTSAGTPKNGGIEFINCHISAQMDVYNDVCANYQYYAYRYTGMLIGSVRENETIDGHVYPKMDKITASGCTVHFGDWNDYYYCELVANTTASYTHDHQMSRLTEIKAINGTTITYLDGTTGTVPTSGRANYVIVDYTKGHGTDNATCYHFVDGAVWNHEDAGYHNGENGEKYIDENKDGEADLKEDKQHIYLEFTNLVTGYGWGVTTKGVGDLAGVTILDDKYNNGESSEKFKTNFTGNFLYRVGNLNTVSLGSLFTEIDGEKLPIVDSGVWVTVEAVDENMTVGGTFNPNTTDWTKGTIQFTGTGVVKVTIQDYIFCTPTVLYLEVVDATNLTSATGTTTGGNFVLLCDVNTTTYVNYWNCTLYGNGFTYSLKGAPTAYNSKQGHGILITKNATFDNLVIEGDVYDTYGAYSNQDNYNAAVDVLGETTIQNCHISNCAAPVLARASVTIVDTTLYGGTVANLLIKSGVVTLENVTTANYDDGRTLVGMGIVVHSDATEATKLVLNGTLTQYNFISESKTPSDSNAKILYNAMFNASCSQYHFGESPNRYVNSGIISMTEKFNKNNIIDKANTAGYYEGASVKVNGVNGYVYTQPNTSGSVNNGYNKENDPHVSTTQGAVPPSVSFDYTDKNYVAKTDGSNDYCYEENGIVFISMDEGDTFNWDTSILTATKLGQTLDYTVSMNGTDYTGKSIAFDTLGSYAVTYTYTDNSNYGINDAGEIITYSETYNKTVYITVTTVKAAWKNAEIKVNNTAMSGIYVMSGDYDYSYKMKFLNCITITDYDEAGNATTVDLSKNIKSTSFVDKNGANPGKFDANSGTITITYNDGKILTVSIGAWSGSGPSTKTCSVKTDDGVYLITDGASNAANTGVTWKVTGYTYTGNNGAIVENNTTITFTWDTNSEGYNSKSSGSCVTPDTLVTLADGTQVRVDALTGNEMLLVWNHQTGTMESVPVAYIVNHDGVASECEVISLNFSNGRTVKIIGEHVFFDATLNKYVAITTANAEEFIGHKFAAIGADGNALEMVELSSIDRTIEITTVYEVVSYKHLTCFTEGILSTSAYLDPLLNVFDINEDTLAYDAELVQSDIEKYGLYTYADFEGLISEEAFELYNAAYLKIAVGKGYITWDDILELIDIYFAADVQPV